MRALLEMLDAGQVVVLEQVEDTSLRSKLQAALEALGLPAETLPDGSIAHAKPDGMDASLAAQFSTVLDDDDAAVGSAADGSAADREEEEEAEEAPEAPSSKRVYGVAGPPPSRSIGPSSGPPSGGDSIGPAMPPVADKDEQEDEDEEDEEDGIGPALPPPPGADGDAFGALASGKSGGDRRLWWQQEQSAPKPTAPIPLDGGVATTVGQTERDDWMVALPTERTSLNTQGQARQFSRNGVQAAGDLSIWTDAPAEREKKAKAAEARSWGAVGMPGGSGGGGGGGGGEPMTLAEAVALARENAASGKRPRGFETGGNGGGGGGGGGAADDGPKASPSWRSMRSKPRARRRQRRVRRIGRVSTRGSRGTGRPIWTYARRTRRARSRYSTTSTWGRWAIGLAAEEGTRPSCERKKRRYFAFRKTLKSCLSITTQKITIRALRHTCFTKSISRSLSPLYTPSLPIAPLALARC